MQAELTRDDVVAFLDQARDLLFILDMDGRIQWTNPAAAQMLGQDLVGASIADVLSKEDAARAFERIAERRNGGPSSSEPYEVTVETPAGVRVLEFSAWLAGQQIQGIARDITVRRQFQHTVRESENKFRQWLEQIPLAVYRTSPDGRILDGNAALAKMLGAPSIAALKKHRATQFFAHGQGRARNLSGRLHDGDVQAQDIHLKRLDGTTFWARDVGRVIRDEQGKILFFDGTLEDITERHELAHVVEKSEQKYRSLVDQLPVGVYRSRPDGVVEDANPALLNLLGFDTVEDLLAANANDLYVDPADRDDWLAELRAGKGVVDREFHMRRADGSRYWIRDVATAVRDADGQIVSMDGSVQDITKRKHAEATVTLLMRVSRAIVEAEDYDAALRDALEAVCDATGWEYGEAWVPGPGGDVLLPSDAWISKKDGLEKFRHLTKGLSLMPGEGVAGEVWAERRIGYYPDLVHMPNFVRAAAAKAVGFEAGVFVPVTTNGHVTSLLVFLTKRLDEQRVWADAMQAIAGQVGSLFQRRAMEDRLALQQMMVDAQLRATDDAVLSLGIDGSILAANDALLALCGATASGTGGVLERMDDPDAFLREVAKLYTGAKERKETITYRGRRIERRGAPIESPDGRRHGRVWTFRDVGKA